MSRNEFMSWCEFYRLSPFDDRHRYHRPAALIATSMSGSSNGQDIVGQMLDWLDPGEAKAEAESTGFTQADINTFKALGMTPPKRSKT